MSGVKLQDMTTDQLIERFIALALGQAEAELVDDNAKYNHLYRQVDAVRSELKGRPGDLRRALIRLYDHPKAQVRLNAAMATLALAPEAARDVLQNIKDRREFPQALDAGMTLRALNDGTFKPT